MSDNHSEQVSWLWSLEIEYHKRYQRKETETDLHTAIQQFQESLDHHMSHTLDRLRCDVLLTRLHVKAEDWLLTH